MQPAPWTGHSDVHRRAANGHEAIELSGMDAKKGGHFLQRQEPGNSRR
jgi:hypothetical protein